MSCNIKSPKATNSNYICSPLSGRWILKNGKTARKLIRVETVRSSIKEDQSEIVRLNDIIQKQWSMIKSAQAEIQKLNRQHDIEIAQTKLDTVAKVKVKIYEEAAKIDKVVRAREAKLAHDQNQLKLKLRTREAKLKSNLAKLVHNQNRLQTCEARLVKLIRARDAKLLKLKSNIAKLVHNQNRLKLKIHKRAANGNPKCKCFYRLCYCN